METTENQIVSVERGVSFHFSAGLGSKGPKTRTGLHGLPDCQSWSVS